MKFTPTKIQLILFTCCAVVAKIIKPQQFRYATVKQIVNDLSANIDEFAKEEVIKCQD